MNNPKNPEVQLDIKKLSSEELYKLFYSESLSFRNLQSYAQKMQNNLALLDAEIQSREKSTIEKK